MKILIRRAAPAVLVVICAAASYWVIGIWSAPEKSQQKTVVRDFRFLKEKKHWEDVIALSGATDAYQTLKAKYEKMDDVQMGHLAAHLFGEILFERFGSEGVVYCGPDFNYGCYHQFFISAVRTLGLDKLPEIGSTCATLADIYLPQCLHGIGHGVLGVLGYDEAALSAALLSCEKITDVDPNNLCYSGVFMEYDLRFLKHAEVPMYSVSVRPLSDDPHEPCSTVDIRYQPWCYFEHTDWWVAVLGDDYELMGRLCGEVADTKAKRFCFRGAGKSAAWPNTSDIERTIRRCKMMPEDGRNICTTMASVYTYRRLSYERTLAEKVCAAIPDEKGREYCSGVLSEEERRKEAGIHVGGEKHDEWSLTPDPVGMNVQ